MKNKNGELVVGLDIGTTKICVVVAEETDRGIEVIGLGTHPSVGLRRGVVRDFNKTAQAISKAVEEAEKMAQVQIRSANVSISNSFVKGFNSDSMLPLQGRTVTAEDVRRVVEGTQSVTIPEESEVLHVLPQEYMLDEVSGIKNAIGMRGMRLEARCYIVTVSKTSLANRRQCCKQCDVDVDQLVLSALASAEAVLSSDEREMGVAVIDIGGGTTDLLVMKKDAVLHTAVLPVGGNHITNDIAQMMNISASNAEWLKKRYGHCLPGEAIPGDEIEVEAGANGRTHLIDHCKLCEVIEARVAEILQLVNEEIIRQDLDRSVAAVVLTGGVCHLRGIDDVAWSIFNRRVRIGLPHHIGGLVDVVASPGNATAVGLVLLGLHNVNLTPWDEEKPIWFSRMLQGVKSRITGLLGSP